MCKKKIEIKLAHARKTTRLPRGFPPLRIPVGFVRKTARRASVVQRHGARNKPRRRNNRTHFSNHARSVPCRHTDRPARKNLRTHARQRVFRADSHRSGCRSVSFARQRVARRSATPRSKPPETPKQPRTLYEPRPCRSVPALRSARHGSTCARTQDNAPSEWLHTAPDAGRFRSQDSASRVVQRHDARNYPRRRDDRFIDKWHTRAVPCRHADRHGTGTYVLFAVVAGGFIRRANVRFRG